ncbi:MAG: hypothetical protein ACO1O4_16370 [Devosia sp.]
MSARIAPRVDTMGIAFSPHLPKFTRRDQRQDRHDSDRDQHSQREPPATLAGQGTSATDGSLPSAMIFEAALLGNQQAIDPLSPYEMARRQRNEWSPPAYGLHLTDKII